MGWIGPLGGIDPCTPSPSVSIRIVFTQPSFLFSLLIGVPYTSILLLVEWSLSHLQLAFGLYSSGRASFRKRKLYKESHSMTMKGKRKKEVPWPDSLFNSSLSLYELMSGQVEPWTP